MIHICSKELAAEFKPVVKTKAIRIINNPEEKRTMFLPLLKDPLYVSERTYHFDDIDGYKLPTDPIARAYEMRQISECGEKIFDESTAQKILEEFNDGTEFEDILVHCNAGESKSPHIIQ